MHTVAYIFQALAYDMTLLLFLLTPLTLACCKCKDRFAWDINNTNTNLQLTTLTATTLPQNGVRYLTEHNTLLKPNLVSESPCPFKLRKVLISAQLALNGHVSSSVPSQAILEQLAGEISPLLTLRRRFFNMRTRKQPNRHIILPLQNMASGRPRLKHPELNLNRKTSGIK